MAKHKLTVLISGSGTNLQALIDACAAGVIDAHIVHVISNRRNVQGLVRAQTANIPTSYHNLLQYKNADKAEHGDLDEDRARSKYDADLANIILEHQPRPDLVVCAGFMHILKPAFLDPLDHAHVKIINLHPALPGQYDGKDAIERAFADFQRGKVQHTGMMIHYVIAEVDRGQPIVVQKVPFEEGESEEHLKERFHAQEHVAIVQGTNLALKALPGLAPAAQV